MAAAVLSRMEVIGVSGDAAGLQQQEPTKGKKPCPDLSGEAFCPLPLGIRLLMTAGPLLGFGLFFALAYLVIAPRAAFFLLSMGVGTFVGGGKLVILAGAVENAPLGIWSLAGLVVFSDCSTASILMANIHHLYRLPFFGPRLAAAREAGYHVLKVHRWMARAAWFGLALFVAVPFQGTGAVLGVILGRILGLSRWAIFAAVVLGSIAGATLMGSAGKIAQRQIAELSDQPVLGIVTVVVSLGLTYLSGRWFLGQQRDEDKS